MSRQGSGRRRARRLPLDVALMAMVLCAGGQRALAPMVVAASGAQARSTVPVFLQWIAQAARQPATIFAGGARFCKAATDETYCPLVLLRSTDGGTTWTDLSQIPDLGPSQDFFQVENAGYDIVTAPIVVTGDGEHLYADTSRVQTTPAGLGMSALRSADGGATWKNIGPQQSGYGDGSVDELTISPVADTQLYARYYPGGWSNGVASSADGGSTWQVSAPDGKNKALAGIEPGDTFTIVPDTAHARTIYANVTGKHIAVLRSDDAGATWTPIAIPAASPPLRSFSVSTDPWTPGMLVGQSADAGVPADRRYRSTDEGVTWQIGTCGGDLRGVCPRFVVQNVFGAGASYAFQPDGIYRFHGTGQAEARLGISATLPFSVSDVLAVTAGTTPTDAVYVLSQDPGGSVPVRLYRGADQGRRWQDLTPRMLPNLAPAGDAPGSRYMKQTGHSIAAPFVPLYNKLGPHLLGYPVTEPYLRGQTLTQDFEHLRLELHGQAAVIGNMGFEVMAAKAQNYGYALTIGGNPQPRDTPTQRFFSATGHLLRGDFLRFWQTHDGATLLGAPISEAYRGANGDGSGRLYLMQWFEHGRLELHPENRNPTYRILLGLVGRDFWGYARG